MDAIIIYESLTGTTHRAAQLIGDGLYDRQIGAQLFNIKAVDPAAVAEADLVIIGTWTDGLLVVGQKPARSKRIKALPDLTGKQCLVYCTYAIHPGNTIRKMTKIVEVLGGQVLGGMTIRRDHLEGDAAAFVDGAMAAAIK